MSRIINQERGLVAVSNVRLSFPYLFEKNTKFKPCYSVNLLLHKENDKQTIEFLVSIINKLRKKNNITNLPFNNCALRDADNVPDDVKLNSDGYADNHYILIAKNSDSDKKLATKPTIYDQYGKVLENNFDEKIYAGCYVDAIVNLYAYDNNKKGIGCGLSAIMFKKDGDKFGTGDIEASDYFTFDKKPEVSLEDTDVGNIPF